MLVNDSKTALPRQRGRSISLATTYDAHDPVLLEGVIPLVDFLEITPDAIAIANNGQVELHPAIIRSLQDYQTEVNYIVHGVGLSIGSYDGYSETYLSLLEQLLEVVPAKWHSEHLGYTSVDGTQLNVMLAVPRTTEMLKLLVARIKTIMKRIDLPFLLENIVHLLPGYQPEYSDAAFLNILTEETGCGLILDLYNLECDALNYGFNIEAFLEELDLRAVREIHLAGGTNYKGFQLDIHSRAVENSTLDLALQTMDHLPNLEVITYEILPQAVAQNGQQMVVDELKRIDHYLKLHP